MKKTSLFASLMCVLIRKALPLQSLKAPPLQRGGGRRPEGFWGRGLLRDKYFILMLLFATIATCALAVNGDMGLGTEPLTDGSETYPYLIEDLADFDTFADSANAATYWAAGVHTKLMTNIDLSGRTYTPIGNSANQYFGIFDGNNLEISNIYLNRPSSDYLAVFGYLGENSHVSNLGAINLDISGRNNVGGIAGKSYGTISNCHAMGAINGETWDTGGLVGENYGEISNSHASCEIDGGDYYTGGLVGENLGPISNCYTTGTVQGYWNTGGLVGHNFSTINNCYSVSTVQGHAWYVGGLAGRNSGSISNCYAAGNVYSGDRTGGFVGQNSGSVIACYATGSVIAGEQVGGLVGINFDTIVACYSTGYVSGDYDHVIGGLIGSGGMATACFWDMDASGLAGSAGGKGLGTDEMKIMSIFQNAEWEGKGWVMEDGQDYPRLFWENTNGLLIPPAQPIPLLGSGSEIDPYQIWTPEDFELLSWYISVLDKHIQLKNNMDLSSILVSPIGDLGLFSGVFDGQSYVIKNACIELPDSDFVGLFSRTSPDASINNLFLEKAHVRGRNVTGGLVGISEGEIMDCMFTGEVIGRDDSGGLVGLNNGTIRNCCTKGTVNSSSYSGAGGLAGSNRGTLLNSFSESEVYSIGGVGGLVGFNVGEISTSYANGKLTGSAFCGGLVAINSGTISYCYSASTVSGSYINGLLGGYRGGPVMASFWDAETSGIDDPEDGLPDTDGMVGVSTTEMQAQSTFFSWDFVNDWMMLRPGEDYPRLAWQAVFDGDIAGLYGVDMVDFAYLANYWGLTGCSSGTNCGRADIDSSGDVGLGDLIFVAQDWLKP